MVIIVRRLFLELMNWLVSVLGIDGVCSSCLIPGLPVEVVRRCGLGMQEICFYCFVLGE